MIRWITRKARGGHSKVENDRVSSLASASPPSTMVASVKKAHKRRKREPHFHSKDPFGVLCLSSCPLHYEATFFSRRYGGELSYHHPSTLSLKETRKKHLSLAQRPRTISSPRVAPNSPIECCSSCIAALKQPTLESPTQLDIDHPKNELKRFLDEEQGLT
jgi:hypothetical protein